MNYIKYFIKTFYKMFYKILNFYKKNKKKEMGIGDWGLGIGPNPQSPIPNPQSPKYHIYVTKKFNSFKKNNKYIHYKIFIYYIKQWKIVRNYLK